MTLLRYRKSEPSGGDGSVDAFSGVEGTQQSLPRCQDAAGRIEGRCGHLQDRFSRKKDDVVGTPLKARLEASDYTFRIIGIIGQIDDDLIHHNSIICSGKAVRKSIPPGIKGTITLLMIDEGGTSNAPAATTRKNGISSSGITTGGTSFDSGQSRITRSVNSIEGIEKLLRGRLAAQVLIHGHEAHHPRSLRHLVSRIQSKDGHSHFQGLDDGLFHDRGGDGHHQRVRPVITIPSVRASSGGGGGL